MKRFLMLAFLSVPALTACTPAMLQSNPLSGIAGPGTVIGAVQSEGSKFTVGGNVLTLNNAGEPLEDTVLVLIGTDHAAFKVDTAALAKVDPGAKCYAENQGWVCKVGTVNKAYGVPYSGKLSRAYGNGYRGTEKFPVTVAYP